MDDFMRPERVVVVVEICRPLFLRDFPIVTTDLESAEMIKYAANAFLETKITFINEIAPALIGGGAKVRVVDPQCRS